MSPRLFKPENTVLCKKSTEEESLVLDNGNAGDDGNDDELVHSNQVEFRPMNIQQATGILPRCPGLLPSRSRLGDLLRNFFHQEALQNVYFADTIVVHDACKPLLFEVIYHACHDRARFHTVSVVQRSKAIQGAGREVQT